MQDDDDRASREALFSALPGGRGIVDWFGFVPSFHDASLQRLELADHTATLTLRAFRMTSEVDDKGHFILDRHARVIIHLSGIDSVSLTGHDASSIIGQIRIRRLVAGFEVSWDSSYGLDGVIQAREVGFTLEPA